MTTLYTLQDIQTHICAQLAILTKATTSLSSIPGPWQALGTLNTTNSIHNFNTTEHNYVL